MCRVLASRARLRTTISLEESIHGVTIGVIVSPSHFVTDRSGYENAKRSARSGNEQPDDGAEHLITRGYAVGAERLPCCPDHPHHPHPLSLIRHRDQLLPMSAPFDVASHAEERPADLAQGLVAIPADWHLTAAPRPGTRSGLRALTVLVEPDRGHRD